MLEFKLNGGKGVRQGKIGANSDEFLRRWAKGALTLDLIVTEFWKGCGQMDLASACVLRPLNRPVLDFETGGLVGWMSEGLGYTGPEMMEGIIAGGGVKADGINGT